MQTNSSKKLSRKVILRLTFIVMLVGLLSLTVVADRFHTFKHKNEIIKVDGHEIIMVDATIDKECIFTINQQGFVIPEKTGKKGNSEVKIYVQRAIAIRSKSKEGVYCEALIDVIRPKSIEYIEEPELESDTTEDQPIDEEENQAQPILEDKENTSVEQNDSQEDTLPTKKQESDSIIQRIINFLRSLFN